MQRKDRFHHAIASIRAAVEKGFERKIFVPYDRLFKKNASGANTVLRGEVTDVLPEEKAVVYTDADGNTARLQYDYLVLATGSSYGVPIKAASNNHKESQAVFQRLQAALAAAKDVVRARAMEASETLVLSAAGLHASGWLGVAAVAVSARLYASAVNARLRCR